MMMYQLWVLKLQLGDLAGPQAEADRGQAQPSTTGRLAPTLSSMRPPIWAAITKPMKK